MRTSVQGALSDRTCPEDAQVGATARTPPTSRQRNRMTGGRGEEAGRAWTAPPPNRRRPPELLASVATTRRAPKHQASSTGCVTLTCGDGATTPPSMRKAEGGRRPIRHVTAPGKGERPDGKQHGPTHNQDEPAHGNIDTRWYKVQNQNKKCDKAGIR